MTSRTGNREGFTFIEAMAAVVILSIVLVGVIRAYASVISAIEIAESRIDAIHVLKTKMAERLLEYVEEKSLAEGVRSGVSESGRKNITWLTEVTHLEPPEEGVNFFLIEIKGSAADESKSPPANLTAATYKMGYIEGASDITS